MAQPTTRGAALLSGGAASGGMVETWLPVPITTNLNTIERDTGIDLPANALLLDVILWVKNRELTGTNKWINVGILSTESGGDADGFCAGIPVQFEGFRRPEASLFQNSNETYFTSTLRGELLAPWFLAGSNVAGDVGSNYEKSFQTSSITGKSISITAGSPFFEFRGTVFFRLLQLGY